MTHKNNLDPNFIKKLRQHYDVNPQPEFMSSLKSNLMNRFSAQQRTAPKYKPRRAAIALVGTFAALIIVFFTTPVYDVLGQIFIELFPKTESNIAPHYPAQTRISQTANAELNATTTPVPTVINSVGLDITITATDTPVEPTMTPDPGSRESANLNIGEVEEVAGFDFLTPALLPHANPYYGAPIDEATNRVMIFPDWQTVLVPAESPDAREFFGASYDPKTNIAYLWYRNFVIKQEPITGMHDCDLCTEVGSDAEINNVQIGDVPGGIVIGVWNLIGETKYWKNEPYMQRLRWESNSVVFEILYDYIPGTMTYESFIEMAESFE